MPAVTPNKPASSNQTVFFKSFRKVMFNYPKRDFSSSKNSNRSFSMYDKFYSSARRPTDRVSKFNQRRGLTEPERCTNLEQREQYRKLIEQYCNKTLAETEKLFCFKNPLEKVVNKDTSNSSIIVINDTPPSQQTRERPNADGTYMAKSFRSATAKRSPLLMKSSIMSTTVSEKEERDTSQSGNITPKAIVQSTASFETPKTKFSDTTNWFSPPSPYISHHFISDLVSSYGRRERERKRKVHEEETRARLLKEKREMKQELLTEMLKAKLNVEPIRIPELTEEQEVVVVNALNSHPGHEVLREQFNISITRQLMGALDGLNWLNDEIINFYMELIVDRSKKNTDLPSAHAMNTFFYPKLHSQGYKSVRRWTKRVDVFSKNLLFFPIHLGVHWTLAMADLRSKEISYFDSMGGDNSACLQTIKNYLVSEMQDKKNQTLDVSQWKLTNKEANEIPQQLNGSDCGVFTCTFAEFLSRDSELSFHQDDMPLLRRTMVWEIVNGTLTR